MSWVGTAIVGGAVVGGYFQGEAAEEAAGAQIEGAELATAERRRQFDAIQESRMLKLEPQRLRASNR